VKATFGLMIDDWEVFSIINLQSTINNQMVRWLKFFNEILEIKI